MDWPFRRRRTPSDPPGPTGVVGGLQPSPGLAALFAQLSRKPPKTVLDLGPSSSPNIECFSNLGAEVTIVDLMRSISASSGRQLAMPESVSGDYDVILMWDLLHYLEAEDRRLLVSLVEAHATAGTLLLLLASAKVAIPAQPVSFQIEPPEQLNYVVEPSAMLPPPGLHTRNIEQLLAGFRPLRSFQLRNGLQEFLFTYRPARRGSGGRDPIGL